MNFSIDTRPCIEAGHHILTQRHGGYDCPVSIRAEREHRLCLNSAHSHSESAGHGICDVTNQYWELSKLAAALLAYRKHSEAHRDERMFSQTNYPGRSGEERTLNSNDLIETAYLALTL